MDRLPNSLPISEPVCRQGEVLTGPERRRRWSLEEKARIVAESLAPGAVAGVVARRYGVDPNQLYGWRRDLRSAAGADRLPDFVPVAVAPASLIAGDGAAGGAIEIVLGPATVRVPCSADAASLRRVLDVVRGLS